MIDNKEKTVPASTLTTDRRVTLTFWAVTLIGSGLWLLLLNFDLLARFEPTAQYILAGLLTILGVGFFGAFLTSREKWWRLVPGWLLLTLAAMVMIPTYTGREGDTDGRLVAAVLFWGMAVAFLHIFLLRRRVYWWAIIPSGFMLVLGGMVAASIYITRLETLGALLSIGMGLVFIWLYAAARAEQGWWPLIPAVVLILFGVAAFTAGSNIQNVLFNLWPLLLVAGGAYLGWLGWRKSAAPSRRMEVHSASGTASSEEEGVLGAYTGPAPGASVEVLDDDPQEKK
jgi:hypothetical protein